MKMFRVDVRIRNNLLVKRREEIGLSAPQFAKKVGVPYSKYLDYENMREIPTYKDSPQNRYFRLDGTWKESAMKIANFHGVSPEQLWPDAVLKVRKPFVSLEMDVQDLVAFSNTDKRALPESAVITSEAEIAIRRALASLDPIEEKIIRLRFGVGRMPESGGSQYCDHTLEEVAMILGKGWTRERVRKAEERALKRLRHPAQSKYLKDFHGDESR